MQTMKKRILSALCAALLLLSLTACGGKTDAGSGGAGDTGSTADAAPAAMSKEDYLEKVEGLNAAATEFAAATAEFVSAGLSNPDDTNALKESIEKIRVTKDAFLEFQGITNPAEGYEEAHTALAEDCGDFGDLINEYCDILTKALDEGSDPSESDIQSRMETVVTSLGESLGAIEAIE